MIGDCSLEELWHLSEVLQIVSSPYHILVFETSKTVWFLHLVSFFSSKFHWHGFEVHGT